MDAGQAAYLAQLPFSLGGLGTMYYRGVIKPQNQYVRDAKSAESMGWHKVPYEEKQAWRRQHFTQGSQDHPS